MSTTLWEKYGTFRRGSDFRPWAFQIAHYKVLNFRQRQARRPRLFADEMMAKLAGDRLRLDDSLEARSRALADCDQRLGPEDRESRPPLRRGGHGAGRGGADRPLGRFRLQGPTADPRRALPLRRGDHSR